MIYNLSTFSSVENALGVITKKWLSKPGLQKFMTLCSSKSVIVLAPSLRSLIYFELILYMSCCRGPNYFAGGYPVVLLPFVEKNQKNVFKFYLFSDF